MTTTLINLFAFIISYVAMEGVAWTTHKYVMHGFLWRLTCRTTNHTQEGLKRTISFFFSTHPSPSP